MRALPLGLLLLALTACGGEPERVAAPSTALEVRLVADEGTDPQTWTLTCDPVGGDHPAPEDACADLAAEQMPFAPLSGDVCSQVFGGPETATVRGTYRGQPVSLDLSRTDGCRTAQWDRLGAVLPPAPVTLDALRAALAGAVVAVDYDGTLAPVVADPTQAVPVDGAVEALAALAPRVGTLALVTGRPADVVVALGGLSRVPGLVVLGQYGAQRWSGGDVDSAPPLPGVEQARAALPTLLAPEGAVLEDKGLALVVHTRPAADPAGALARLEDPVRALAERAGLEVHRGRLVLEVRPPGFDKRGALLSLCDPLPSAVLFAGDDLGDLPAFDAVDALRVRGVPGVTVCSASDEGPPALRERADLVVDGPAGVVALLRSLLD